MNNLMIKDEIENMIYEIRGKQVMLDSDLARLYNCKNGTKTINLAVKRHIDRFPERFMFQLTKEEFINIQKVSNILKFQTETSSRNNTHGGIRKLPYAFTEQGVAMLSTILRTDVASKVSIKIIDAFVKMRKYINNNQNILLNIENKLLEHDTKIDILFDKID